MALADDIDIRIEGRAGRITLTRPEALNAMTYDMCMAIDAALRDWRDDPAVALVLFDATGDKAFCAGGDIAELYATGRAGDFAYGRTFWRDEYRMNALLFEYPKPVVSFLQGFTMGGGVGIGCHGSHRIVGESSRIAMPECGIGLMPDVGGTYILARAPGRIGEYLGLTAARMDAADAIYVGFADHYIPQSDWEAAKAALIKSGTVEPVLSSCYHDPGVSALQDAQGEIDLHFGSESIGFIAKSLEKDESDFAQNTLKALKRCAPLSGAATLAALARLRSPDLDMRRALEMEYRFTYRAMEHGDFLEGIRAQIIDKDRQPRWQFADLDVPVAVVEQMLAPLGENALTFEEDLT